MDKILIVTFYFAERAQFEIFGKVTDLFDRIVIFDNTPSETILASKTEQLDSKTTIIRNGFNVGLAEAYNHCIKTQKVRADDIVMLLDQDTTITGHSALKSYIDRYAKQRKGDEIVGFRGRRLWKKHRRAEKPEAAWVINSGMLFTGQIWMNVGGFDQSFFVDDVDHEFCMRARDLGVTISLIQTNAFIHEVGSPKVFRLPKPFDRISLSSSGHAPWRRYYWAKNRTILLARHRSLFSILLFGTVLRDLVISLAFEDQKLEILSATVRGFLQSFSALKRLEYV